MLAAIWRQYSTRGTKTSRVIMAVAMLLPALSFPESAALAIEGLRNDPATSRVSLAANSESITEPPRAGIYDVHCAPLAVSLAGMQPGWRFDLISQQDTLSAGGKTRSLGWRPAGWLSAKVDFRKRRNWAELNVCLDTAGLNELGAGPLAVHTSVALAVLTDDQPIRFKATLNPFSVPGIGTCQFQYLAAFRHNYELACKAPVWFPREGRIVMGMGPLDSWSSAISTVPYPWTPMNLLPGISPVYKWTTLPMDTQIRETVARGRSARSSKRRRGSRYYRRELTVKEAWFVQD